MVKLPVSGIATILALAAVEAQAAPVTYHFSAEVTVESRGLDGTGAFMSVDDPNDRLFAAGTSMIFGDIWSE